MATDDLKPQMSHEHLKMIVYNIRLKKPLRHETSCLINVIPL